MSTHSSPLPACFRPTTASSDQHPTAVPSPQPLRSATGKSILTTSLFHTQMGIFSLTWSRNALFGHSLHLHHHHASATTSPLPLSPPPSTGLSFHLDVKPFVFWNKRGSKNLTPNIKLFWDLTRAKFGSGPEPISGFYIAVMVDGTMVLLVGDSAKEAYSRTKSHKPEKLEQFVFLRRDHLFGTRVYSTTACIRGKAREVTIDCDVSRDGRLWFGIDGKRVLRVKRLKWKFRGNERVLVDGVPINISWDVYYFIFDDCSLTTSRDRHAVFVFRFEDGVGFGEERSMEYYRFDGLENYSRLGMNETELRKTRKRGLRSARSSSSLSISSSGSSGGGSSVMEWASSDENELSGRPVGLSLLVYAWRR